MEWIGLTILVVVVGAFLFWFQRSSLVDERAARQMIGSGAKVIDVRTESEFRQRNVEGAVNVPLDRLKSRIAQVASDREKPVLLHCAAGGRSAMGVRTLKGMGYSKVYNLGSYHRAERIVKASTTSTGAI